MKPDDVRKAHQAIAVMYSLVFGVEGVATVATILRDELAQNLRLLGAQKLSDLSPRMVSLFRVSIASISDSFDFI